ncbi:hypothetical protein BDB01DRAFT_542994 [Pilobolus umbonatus]|nr:hypothetical protein BDB01DRAFT_542994 [Pilobolus umbonatus]
MSFISGSDCGPVNPMSGLLKQFQQDRSLQQDRFADQPQAESSKAAFRSRPTANIPFTDRQLTDEFFRDEMNFERQKSAFQLHGLQHELERIQPQGQPADWANDFMQHQPNHGSQQFDEFEQIYQQTHQAQRGDWKEEFNSYQHIHANPVLNQSEKAAFEQAFEQAKQNTAVNWEQEFAAQESWATEFEEENKAVFANNDNEALSRTAAMLLDSVDVEANPKFKNSQFMSLMRKLRDSEVAIQGNKMVETQKASWSSEFQTGTSGSWADDFNKQASGSGKWAGEFAQRPQSDWSREFHQNQQSQSHQQGDWTSEFSKHDGEEMERLQKLFGRGTETDEWIDQYNKNIEHLKSAKDKEWDNMQKDWESFQPEIGLGYRATNPEYDTYHFDTRNPYLINHQAINDVEHIDLADSILALEAKVQLQTSDANAWGQLGQKQQENEKDAAAIAALRQAVKINPNLLDAWLALAVSYTNENCRVDAYEALEQWLANHDHYRHLTNKQQSQQVNAQGRHAYVTNMFLEAARSSPGSEMDPDVQVGLGVLFNVSEEYEKAIDCFRAAVASKPQDYLLWNKLGATLANSGDSMSAIDAYFNALQINPNYVRARYNLAISCINLNQHREAAEHLLTALALQRSNDNNIGSSSRMNGNGNYPNMSNGMSDNVWESLRMLMMTMNREDLAHQCDQRNINAFRSDFEF